MRPPLKKEDMDMLFIDHIPEQKGLGNRWDTDAVFIPDTPERNNATRCPHYDSPGLLPLVKGGDLVKVPDGWGGYAMKPVKVDVDSIVSKLLEIQKEYV
jgi:hypothetical protein